MHLQDVVWYIALAGMGLAALGFIFVISQAGKPADEAAIPRTVRNSARLRTSLFATLAVIFVAGSWATLRPYRIPPQSGSLGDNQIVDVAGYQWAWVVKPATVQAGRATEFRVTSGDVNHGFAIYAPDGRIVAQTQAMPGYTNKLLYTFTQPGKYVLQCLEFCGVGHAPMKATLDVVAQ